LTDGQVERLAELGRLWPSVSIDDAARILELDPQWLAAWVATGDGQRLWDRARADGRAELFGRVRDLALEGDPQAQKLLVTAAGGEPSVSDPLEARIAGPTLRDVLGRDGNTLARRAHEGLFLRPGVDRRYRVRDALGVIPGLWDLIAQQRRELAALRARFGETRTEEAEARRQAAVEMARRRKRENDVEEGRLVSAESVRRQIETLASAIREESRGLIAAIELKTGADARLAAELDAERRKFLDRCADRIAAESDGG